MRDSHLPRLLRCQCLNRNLNSFAGFGSLCSFHLHTFFSVYDSLCILLSPFQGDVRPRGQCQCQRRWHRALRTGLKLGRFRHLCSGTCLPHFIARVAACSPGNCGPELSFRETGEKDKHIKNSKEIPFLLQHKARLSLGLKHCHVLPSSPLTLAPFVEPSAVIPPPSIRIDSCGENAVSFTLTVDSDIKVRLKFLTRGGMGFTFPGDSAAESGDMKKNNDLIQ